MQVSYSKWQVINFDDDDDDDDDDNDEDDVLIDLIVKEWFPLARYYIPDGNYTDFWLWSFHQCQ